MTVSIKYATIAPDFLLMILFTELYCSVSYREVNDEYFEISVISDSAWILRRAENILTQYV